MFRRFRSLARVLIGRRRFEDRMSDEIRFHLDAYAADLQHSGLTPEEAARRARAVFGSVDGVREDCRQARGLRWLDELWQDLRYTWRLMRRTPAFTAAAVVSLGLGIGATTAIFAVVESVLLRSLAVDDPGKLYFLAHGDGDRPSTSSNYPLFERYRTADVFSGVTAFRGTALKVSTGELVEIVPGQFVSGNYHAVVRAPVIHGRGFVSESDRPSEGSDIAVISERYWIRRFGRARDVLDRTLTIEGRTVAIVGVTGAEFGGFTPGSPVDITLPLAMYVRTTPRYLQAHDSFTSMLIIARLRPGVSEAQALAAVDAIFQQFMEEPENRWARGQTQLFSRARLQPAGKGDDWLRTQYRASLFMLLSMAVLVLVVASANVANLLLSRSTARAREVAVRRCVGGDRWRILRQFLTESAVLAVLGGACGVLLAIWGASLILALFSTWRQPIVIDVSLNVRVLGFAAAVTLATGLAFGMVPALKGTRVDLTAMLKGDSAGSGIMARRPLLSRALVVGQVALCVMVLVVAALLAQSVRSLKARPAGFDAANVLLFDLNVSSSVVPRTKLESLYVGLLDYLRRLPGVASAAASTSTPIHTSGDLRGLALPGLPETPEARGMWANYVTTRYFETMGIRVLRGRAFTSQDMFSTHKVAVLNQRAARHVFGDADPIGRTIAWMGAPEQPIEVVGLVDDTLQDSLRADAPRMVYSPLTDTQLPRPIQVALRTTGDPISLAGNVRTIVRSVHPEFIVERVRTMDAQIDAFLVRERAVTWLSVAFAFVALILACVGVYGVMSYNVARRVREFGIRLALGEREHSLLRAVLGEAMSLAFVGIVLGVGGTLLVRRLISNLLYGVPPHDLETVTGVSVALLAMMLIAAYLPARRAARVDPMRAIRAE